MRNLLTNEQLLNDLQETVDDGEIQEQADEILEAVMSLGEGSYEQLHDIEDNAVVRVYRSEAGFNLYSTACDLSDYAAKTHFNFADYESGFGEVEGFDYEALAERKVQREKVRADKAQTKLQRFLHIEKAYADGAKNVEHPYLTAKDLTPADINIEYSVINTDLFHSNKSFELLIYKLNDDAYQVITPVKINDTNKFIIIREEGAMRGSYAVVGDGVPEFTVEGLADAITTNMALGKAVAVGVSANNIKVIAQELPELILIGDNDEAGRNAAKSSGLDAIFCPGEHKDVDDFRQASGIRSVKSYLECKVNTIMIDREPLLGESGRQITLVSAPPGSGKSYLECQSICQRTGLTIYAVHNKKAMGQDDSRVSEIRMLCGENDYALPTIRTVNDSAHEDTIKVQFEKALNDYSADDSENKNWVVFITHKALSLLDFDQDVLLTASLVIDEVPEAYNIHAESVTRKNLQDYLDFFEVTSKECTNHYVVTLLSLSYAGRTFYYNKQNKSNLETRHFWSLIDQVLSNRNHSNFLIVDKAGRETVFCMNRQADNCLGYYLNVSETPKLYKCEMFDSSVFDNFRNVRLLSDDVENSLFVLLLKNTQGVRFEIERLPNRHTDGIAHRIDRIIGITDKVFSKHKIEARPDLSNNIAAGIARECDMTNSLWLLNNSSRENGDSTVWLEQQGHNVTDFNPMTHGRNDLTRHDVIVMLYSLKPSPVEVALLDHLGISQEQITRWREHNVHMQNAFRGSLRNPNGDATGTLVLPDKASVDYFLERIESEWGIDERNFIEAKVSYIDDEDVVADFENKPTGRKCFGDEPLTGSQKNRLSRWRKEFPELNAFAEVRTISFIDLLAMKKRKLSELYQAWNDSLVQVVERVKVVNDTGYTV
tara:strand:+ start:3745 stop:6396 length:2652 start_codon:yes stop_codon:yes gene_type:complete